MQKTKKTYDFYTITTPDGKAHRLFFNENTDRLKLLEDFVWGNWSRYIENNWLNYRRNDRTCPEEKIKWLFDGCGNLLLMGETKDSGILSRYKEMQIGNNEVPVSDLEAETYGHLDNDQELNDDKAAQTVPKKEGRQGVHKSKFIRMNEMLKSGKLESVRVDTENTFSYRGSVYQISDCVKQYQPKQTKIGVLYDADTVYVFTPFVGKSVQFQGQDLSPLDGMVKQI